MKGSCRPIIAASVVSESCVTAPSVVTGAPRAPNATGAVLKIRVKTSSLERRKAQRDQQGTGDRNRRAKTRNSLQQTAEAEADHDEHDAAVVRKMVEHPVAKVLKAAGNDSDVVQDQSVEHDPHHRNERERGTGEHTAESIVRRQVPDRDGEDESRCEAGR